MTYPSLTTLVKNNRLVFVIMSLVITVLIMDTLLVKVYPFTTSYALSSWWLLLFSFIVIVYVFGQYFVMKVVKSKTQDIISGKRLNLEVIDKSVAAVQYGFMIILFLIFFEMITMSRYTTSLLAVATGTSYMLSIVMFGLLAIRFFRWHQSNRNLLVLLYGLASLSLALNGVFTVALTTSIFTGLPVQTLPHIGFYSPSPVPGSISYNLSIPYIVSNVGSFILTWVATSVLLLYYSQKLKKKRYWSVITVPLIYFLIQLFPLIPTVSINIDESNPILFSILSTTVFSLSNPVGGILFGIAFWIATRSLAENNKVKSFLIISAYGFILFFTSNQAIILVSAPYPPFGLPTILFVGLSSYLVLIGIYCTAISVAQDSRLRRSIRRLATKEAALFDSIGLSQMSGDIERKAITLTKLSADIMKEETGVPPSLTDDEIKRYLHDAIREAKGIKE